ncbi:hypothetical protein [Aquimarina sp. RZ0]|uniref:hypothetical protein n=1 Tax=Aquimarina sp. RZ0 TaxID=2607730 RepID=UPI0011F26790|nr:hypothetical protein [Aquimarina sp. RZ0]KAA1247932.1 hypothetical protein F0000_01550 [Aquimarina sp. RZ0]
MNLYEFFNHKSYKSFKTPDDRIGENKYYQMQLWNNLKCNKISIRDAENIRYQEKDLIAFLIKYNDCINPDVVVQRDDKKRRAIFLT